MYKQRGSIFCSQMQPLLTHQFILATKTFPVKRRKLTIASQIFAFRLKTNGKKNYSAKNNQKASWNQENPPPVYI